MSKKYAFNNNDKYHYENAKWLMTKRGDMSACLSDVHSRL